MQLVATFDITPNQEAYMRQALDRLTSEINVGGLDVGIVRDSAPIVDLAPEQETVIEPQAEPAIEPATEPEPEIHVAETIPEAVPVETAEVPIDIPADSGAREDTSGETVIVP